MKPASKNFILYGVSALTDCAGFLLIFAVSRELAESQADLFKLGIVGGGISLLYALSSYASGRLSDRVGRRRLIVAGTALIMLAALGCSWFTADAWVYYLSYWCCGIGMGMVFAPLVAWLSQEQTPGRRARGMSGVLIRFCLAWNFGLMSGQLSGGVLFPVDRSLPALLAAGLMILSMILLLGMGKRTRPAAQETVALDENHLAHLAMAGGFARIGWISNLGGAFSISMVIHLFPKLAVTLNVPPEAHGTVISSMRITVLGLYFLMYRSHWWHYRYATALMAQGAGIGGLIVLSMASGVWGLTLGLLGIGVLTGYNYFASLYYSTAGNADASRGSSTGMHEATLGLGFAAGSFGGGLVGSFAGPRAPYVLAIAFILLLIIPQVFVYLRRIKPLHEGNSRP